MKYNKTPEHKSGEAESQPEADGVLEFQLHTAKTKFTEVIENPSEAFLRSIDETISAWPDSRDQVFFYKALVGLAEQVAHFSKNVAKNPAWELPLRGEKGTPDSLIYEDWEYIRNKGGKELTERIASEFGISIVEAGERSLPFALRLSDRSDGTKMESHAKHMDRMAGSALQILDTKLGRTVDRSSK